MITHEQYVKPKACFQSRRINARDFRIRTKRSSKINVHQSLVEIPSANQEAIFKAVG